LSEPNLMDTEGDRPAWTENDRVAALDQIWQGSEDLMAISDGLGFWLSVNPAWTKVLGWANAEMLGQECGWLEHPDDAQRIALEIARLRAGLPTSGFNVRLRCTDGSFRLINWTCSRSNEQIYHVGRDITVEHEREAALHDLQDFTRLALSAVNGVGVWTYDVASDCFTCDPAVSELYDIDPDQAAKGIWREGFLANVLEEDRGKLLSTMAGGLAKRGDLELEYRIKHKDGTVRWVLSRGHTYFDAEDRPVRRTGVAIETTKNRMLEAQLRQSQKMEAVGQLTGGLAHDFNNLLTSIMGNLELLQNRVSQGRFENLSKYADTAREAAKRAAALTHRLLAFSRRQTLDSKPTDANQLVSGMEELINRTVGPEIEVETFLFDTLWTTLCDPNQLENAILNLAINGRDAMPDGGMLTIETANVSLDPPVAQERDMAAGDYVEICVTDTGTGMPPDVIAHAFDPFYTTKPTGEGTGLGLSMIYGFVKQSGGQVRIYSEVDTGTTMRLYLPRHAGEMAFEQPLPELSQAPRARSGETVLVVDDEPTVRMLITEVLGELGYEAIEAADGARALQVLTSDVQIDLLITDVGLPGGINGRQVADAGKQMRPLLKVLFITGYAENAALKSGQLEPGMRVMTKPFALEALASIIQSIITNSAETR
jgi:PAS domain S-box-containing protein